MSDDVKFPDITVPLLGEDGNAGVIMGRVTRAMREAGISRADIDAYRAEAMLGDYDNLLRVTMRTVDVT